MRPPEYIDGAKVIMWAWSGPRPFGYMGSDSDQESIEVYGFAICRYEKSGSIYRFSCNRVWETENDAPWDTIENAMRFIPSQYDGVEVVWHSM
jgi:hypothetical protein